MNIGIIGQGAIGRYVCDHARERGHVVRAVLVRPVRLQDIPDNVELMIDCAGHQALKSYGPDILRGGTDLATVSIGALADTDVHESLERAAAEGNSKLYLASGAIGALDCLRAARVGSLREVTYVGRKPPRGWKGSPAEDQLDLDNLDAGAEVHFDGTARVAATEYPKNANVAAAVALAGIGFDATRVKLIADPNIDENIHEVRADGEFGQFSFEIRGRSLPDNPRSSALAAMSVVSMLEQEAGNIRF